MAENESKQLAWSLVGKELQKKDKGRLLALAGRNPFPILFQYGQREMIEYARWLQGEVGRAVVESFWRARAPKEELEKLEVREVVREAISEALPGIRVIDGELPDRNELFRGLEWEDVRELAMLFVPDDEKTRILDEAMEKLFAIRLRDAVFSEIAAYLSDPSVDPISKGAAGTGTIEAELGSMFKRGGGDDEQ